MILYNKLIHHCKLSFQNDISVTKRFYPGSKDLVHATYAAKTLFPRPPLMNNISAPRTITVLNNPLIYSRPIANHILQRMTPFKYTNNFKYHQSDSQISNKKLHQPPINFESILEDQAKKELQNILKQFIYNESNNIPQPKTDIQLIKEKVGQLKQKEKQLKNKLEKEKKLKQLPKNTENTDEN